ncbi:GNAT family N-acetyltransferase [uncultured Paraglaciecola sp.]|uniref:GNAT family N-acetyltransferase n=1 Tax=uncultured Paraglaciecola sp. TaxID=1765024 RepID=UPI00263333AB|nr:GNAT family N-acetyltransferase [uncultured Paraglaciecola sp.]
MNWEIKPATDFKQYKSDWDNLNIKGHNLPILNSIFIESLLNHFFEDNEKLAIGYDQDKIACMVFLRRKGLGQWESVMPSQAPICLMVQNENSLTENTLKTLCKALPGWVLQLDLLQLDSRNLTIPTSSHIKTMDYITTGNRPIPSSFEEYFASLGKNLRQNYNKVVNRAARADQKLSTQLIVAPNEVTEAVTKYAEIEARSWKAELGTAITPSNIQGRFYSEMMTNLSQTKQACCWYYLVDNQVVACDLCVIQEHTLIILKTTFDDAFKQFSPALQLKVDMIRHYSEHPELGITNIEFFGKAMEWHKRLDSELRGLFHLTYIEKVWVKFILKIISSLRR